MLQSIGGSKREYENRYAVPAFRCSPRGDTVAAPTYSSVKSQSPSESGFGVTRMVSATRPDIGITAAIPRCPTTRHLPAGPSTRRRSGEPRALSTGHNFGERQSYGPHSSTMIAERGNRAIEVAAAREGMKPLFSG